MTARRIFPLRLAAEEREELDEAAARVWRSTSDYIRLAALEKARRTNQTPAVPKPRETD